MQVLAPTDSIPVSAEDCTRLTIDYAPWDFMMRVHECGSQYMTVAAHRRCGKTLMAVNWLIREITSSTDWQPVGLFIGPTLQLAKEVSWAYFLHYTQNIAGVRVNISDSRITFPNGGTITLKGSTDPDKIKGRYLTAAVMDESAQHPPDLWHEVILPMLDDRGRTPGRVMFIGTFKGKNFFWELARRAISDPDWNSFIFPASKTSIFTKQHLEKLKEKMGDAKYNQEYELDVNAAIVGTYFGQEMAAAWIERRISNQVHYEPEYPVYCAFDLGVDLNLVIWFAQATRYEVRILDYHEGNNGGIPGLANLIRAKPYSIEALILPHDGHNREGNSNLSRTNQWIAQGFRVIELPRGKVENRIDEARKLLPKCAFHAERCAIGIDHLSYFKVSYNPRLGITKPQVDKSEGHDHAADAFSHLAMGMPSNAGRYTRDELSYIASQNAQARPFRNM